MKDTWWVRPEDLNDEQRDAISLKGGNHLIMGPPGCGKTNLLILHGTYLVRNGSRRVLMLVFTRTLEEFISRSPLTYRPDPERLKTIQRWEMGLIHQLGGTPSDAADFMAQRRENAALLNSLIEEQELGHLYDAILIDEAQDCIAEEIELFFNLSDSVFAVADSRQQIYDSDGLPILLERCMHHPLKFHYRNGRAICVAADDLGKEWRNYVKLIDTSQYKESLIPSEVRAFQFANVEDQAASIIKNVRLQIKAYPDELIGVICPRRKELAIIRSAFEESDLHPVTVYQMADEGYVAFTDESRVCICTVHSAKGLEFRATHIAGAEFFSRFKNHQRRLAYTAVTRTKTILGIYHKGALPSYLEGAISAAGPKAEPVTVDDLFDEA